MALTAIQIIGIVLIIAMIIIIIAYSVQRQYFYNYKLPILGEKYDLKLSTLVSKMQRTSTEPSSEEPSSEEPSSEEPSSEEPLMGMYISKQIYLKQKQFPTMKIVTNQRPSEPKPKDHTMRRILHDLSNSGILS